LIVPALAPSPPASLLSAASLSHSLTLAQGRLPRFTHITCPLLCIGRVLFADPFSLAKGSSPLLNRLFFFKLGFFSHCALFVFEPSFFTLLLLPALLL
jgi:hypothetical protein